MTEPVDLSRDGVFTAAQATLWFCGAIYIGLGLCIPFAFINGAMAEPGTDAPPAGLMVFFGGVMFFVAAGCAIGNFVAAWGLRRRKKWAWIVTVVIGGLYAPSGCFFFGAILLYAMMRSGVKESFEQDAREASGAPTSF